MSVKSELESVRDAMHRNAIALAEAEAKLRDLREQYACLKATSGGNARIVTLQNAIIRGLRAELELARVAPHLTTEVK